MPGLVFYPLSLCDLISSCSSCQPVMGALVVHASHHSPPRLPDDLLVHVPNTVFCMFALGHWETGGVQGWLARVRARRAC